MIRRYLMTQGRRQYWQRVKALFGSSLVSYFPMWDAHVAGVTSGALTDISASPINGVIVRAAGEQPGIGDGKTSLLFDGNADYLQLITSAAKMNTAEGGIFFFIKPSTTDIWTDSTERVLFNARIDASNYIKISKDTNPNQIIGIYRGSGTSAYAYASGLVSDGWLSCVLTWNATGTMKLYFNGILPAINGEIGSLTTIAGAITTMTFSGTSTDAWSGYAQHLGIVNREITAAEAKSLTSVLNPKIYTVLGDSIAAASGSWASRVVNTYPGSRVSGLYNRAVASSSVMGVGALGMDIQAAAAVNDNASVIILAIGSNDNNAGDMGALQAEYEENIVELKASNPNATIYVMNVLPRWTDNTGATPVDKANIRTTLAAAAAAQGLTCWDTFTSPWITAAQTSDGVHPTAAGHAAIATQVLARL